MRTLHQRTGRSALALAASLTLAAAAQAAGDVVAIKAGTIIPGGDAAPISDGVVVTEDGKIVAIGKAGEVVVPPLAETLDYGATAVVIPGLVAADSGYTSSVPGPRTADPTVLAIDKFDPYSSLVSALRSGITTVYLAPARGRLIAGQGAVVKTGGGEPGEAEGRVLLETAGLHGSISDEARRTPGYWEPPVPATVDKGLGVAVRQLPRTTMGAEIAIRELMALAGGDASLEEQYGDLAGPALAKAIEAQLVWRMGAESPGEVRTLLDLAEEFNLPMVIDGASGAAGMAEEIAAARVPVIARPWYRAASNFGKGETADWPTYDTIARLAGEGVKVAIASPQRLGTSDLRFAAALAMRGGLSEEAALRGITLTAAEVLGVADRVGSLAPGKDADLVVMTGSPLSTGSTVLATIVGGDVAWTPEMTVASPGSAASKKGVKRGPAVPGLKPAPPVVISVDELHLGDGEILSPGEVLLRGGKIAEVGSRVARPAGASVVRARAAMPGMIDAYGHLGTEGSNRAFSTRFDTTRILEPGDYADREVAKHGVTTVNMISRNVGGLTPSTAYKPAARSFDTLVVEPVSAVRIGWDSNIIATSGGFVRQTLARAKKYADDWDKYEAAMAKWTPPAEEESSEDADEKDDDEDGDKKDKDGDSKKKKKKKKRDPAKPVTGVFEGYLTLEGDDGAEESARFRFEEAADGTITGSLRLARFDELLELEGQREEYDVTLTVETSDGDWTAELAQIYSNDPKPKKDKKAKKASKSDDDEDKEKKEKDDEDGDGDDDKVETYLRGELNDAAGDAIGKLDVTQTSSEFKRIKRPEIEPDEETKRKRAPKGMPKKPNTDPDLEVFRRAMKGQAAVLVSVDRKDQVLACVEAFEAYGIKPVLFDSDEAHLVADRIAGRVSGALVPRNKMTVTTGGKTRNRMVELSSAGIPVAFLSQAEEGAAELGVLAAMAVARGLSPVAAMRGLTSDAAAMLRIDGRVGTLAPGKDGDVVLMDGSPLEVSSSVTRVFVNGRPVR